MKQRPLTDIQLTVIRMRMEGKSNQAIGHTLSIHPATVSCKWRAIQKGIAKGAYNNLPDDLCTSKDLFSQ